MFVLSTYPPPCVTDARTLYLAPTPCVIDARTLYLTPTPCVTDTRTLYLLPPPASLILITFTYPCVTDARDSHVDKQGGWVQVLSSG